MLTYKSNVVLLGGGQISSIYCFQGIMPLPSFDTTIMQCFKSSVPSNGERKGSVEREHPEGTHLIFAYISLSGTNHMAPLRNNRG